MSVDDVDGSHIQTEISVLQAKLKQSLCSKDTIFGTIICSSKYARYWNGPFCSYQLNLCPPLFKVKLILYLQQNHNLGVQWIFRKRLQETFIKTVSPTQNKKAVGREPFDIANDISRTVYWSTWQRRHQGDPLLGVGYTNFSGPSQYSNIDDMLPGQATSNLPAVQSQPLMLKALNNTCDPGEIVRLFVLGTERIVSAVFPLFWSLSSISDFGFHPTQGAGLVLSRNSGTRVCGQIVDVLYYVTFCCHNQAWMLYGESSECVLVPLTGFSVPQSVRTK